MCISQSFVKLFQKRKYVPTSPNGLDSEMWSGHNYLNFGNFPKEAEHGSELSLGVVVFQMGFLDQHQY